jgi:hypothetical protein
MATERLAGSRRVTSAPHARVDPALRPRVGVAGWVSPE